SMPAAILSAAATVRAGAPKHDVVSSDRVLQAPCEASLEPLDRTLETLVLEHGHLAAALAYEVMVVLAAGKGRLVAGSLGELHAPHQVHPGKELERPVDARDPDIAALRSKLVEDLLRREAARLARNQVD